MNKLIIAGHLGADPDSRVMPDGTKVTNLNLAVNVWQKGGEVTIWYNISCWRDQFNNIMPHLKKGSAVIVIGNLKPPRIWTDQSGQARVSMDVDAISLEFPKFGKSQQQEAQTQQASPYDQKPAQEARSEIPGSPAQGQEPAPVGAAQGSGEEDLPF